MIFKWVGRFSNYMLSEKKKENRSLKLNLPINHNKIKAQKTNCVLIIRIINFGLTFNFALLCYKERNGFDALINPFCKLKSTNNFKFYDN